MDFLYTKFSNIVNRLTEVNRLVDFPIWIDSKSISTL